MLTYPQQCKIQQQVIMGAIPPLTEDDEAAEFRAGITADFIKANELGIVLDFPADWDPDSNDEEFINFGDSDAAQAAAEAHAARLQNALESGGPGSGRHKGFETETDREKAEKGAASFISRWSWQKHGVKALPTLATEKVLKESIPDHSVVLHRWEREDHDDAKAESTLPNVPLQSWTRNEDMVKNVVEMNNEDPNSPKLVHLTRTFQPHEIYADFDNMPEGVNKLLEKMSNKGGNSNMNEVLVRRYLLPPKTAAHNVSGRSLASESAKSLSSSEMLANNERLKGELQCDEAGHPFRGNQYTTGISDYKPFVAPYDIKKADKYSREDVEKMRRFAYQNQPYNKPRIEYDPSKVTRLELLKEVKPITIGGREYEARQENRPYYFTGSDELTPPVITTKDAPPMPAYGTQARQDWEKQYRLSDTTGKPYYEQSAQQELEDKFVKYHMDRYDRGKADLKQKDYKDELKDAVTAANNAALKLHETKLARDLGIRPRGYEETDEEYQKNVIAPARSDVNGPFGKNGDFALNWIGGARTARKNEVDSWMLSSDTQPRWAIRALEHQGMSRGDAINKQAKVQADILMSTASPYDKQEAAKTLSRAFTDEKTLDEWSDRKLDRGVINYASSHPELKEKALRYLDDAKKYDKMPWTEKNGTNNQAAVELKSKIDADRDDLARTYYEFAHGVNLGAQMNGTALSSDKAIDAVKDEAKDTLNRPKAVYRGMRVPKDLAKKMQNSISKDGYYDLPASTVWSWTDRKPLAETFSRYGQGEHRQNDEKWGFVVTGEANKDNVWMHPDQPTYKSVVGERTSVGDKFNSGGADQREYILENKDNKFRITKDNISWT